MKSMLQQISARIGRRGIAAAVLLLLVLLAAVATPQLLGARVAAALDTVGAADARWLWLAGVGFAVSVAAAAGSWRCAIGLCGGRISVPDACALTARPREAEGRVSHFLDAFRALGCRPGGAVRLTAWLALSTLGRIAAATAIGAALGINQPLAAAVVIVPALDVAGLIPLTPGNFGVTSGAIAMALQAHGMSFTNGLAAGIAFHAVETAVGLMFGMASIVWLAPYPSPAARRIALLAGAASWALAIAGAFSATVLSQFV